MTFPLARYFVPNKFSYPSFSAAALRESVYLEGAREDAPRRAAPQRFLNTGSS